MNVNKGVADFKNVPLILQPTSLARTAGKVEMFVPCHRYTV